MEPPVLWWGPDSTPVSALLFVSGHRYPDWQGQLLVATLRNGAFTRVKLDGDRVLEHEAVFLAGNERVRDLKLGPDGWIYVLVNSPEGRILRLQR